MIKEKIAVELTIEDVTYVGAICITSDEIMLN